MLAHVRQITAMENAQPLVRGPGAGFDALQGRRRLRTKPKLLAPRRECICVAGLFKKKSLSGAAAVQAPNTSERTRYLFQTQYAVDWAFRRFGWMNRVPVPESELRRADDSLLGVLGVQRPAL